VEEVELCDNLVVESGDVKGSDVVDVGKKVFWRKRNREREETEVSEGRKRAHNLIELQP